MLDVARSQLVCYEKDFEEERHDRAAARGELDQVKGQLSETERQLRAVSAELEDNRRTVDRQRTHIQMLLDEQMALKIHLESSSSSSAGGGSALLVGRHLPPYRRTRPPLEIVEFGGEDVPDHVPTATTTSGHRRYPYDNGSDNVLTGINLVEEDCDGSCRDGGNKKHSDTAIVTSRHSPTSLTSFERENQQERKRTTQSSSGMSW